ncbi:MAG: hypothetical protein ABEJ23_05780 [Haloarculaceae archaeon]
MTDEVDSAAREPTETGGYVHDPAADEESGVEVSGERDRTFGWRGWVLVGFLIVAFLVVPGALYYLPRAQGAVTSLGLSLRDAYLVLPLLPALLLGALAVWATTRP